MQKDITKVTIRNNIFKLAVNKNIFLLNSKCFDSLFINKNTILNLKTKSNEHNVALFHNIQGFSCFFKVEKKGFSPGLSFRIN